MPSEIIAVIIAVEKYSKNNTPQITNVDFAENDARAFKDLLIQHYNVSEKNITIWTNENVLKSTIEQELPYLIRGLRPDDIFFFYYAGHGHFNNGHNFLTMHDTHSANLINTSVSFQDVLLAPLSNNPCKRAYMFIDACSSYILKGQNGRDTISNMDEKEFSDYIHKSTGQACFFSCSPGQKSFPDKNLKNGIWTWHLLKALKGEEPAAIDRDNIITASSLKDYLANAIPRYITKKTLIKDKQEPFSRIDTNTELILRKIIIPEYKEDEEYFRLGFDKFYFQQIEEHQFKKLPDMPFKIKWHSSDAQRIANEKNNDQLTQEIEDVYSRGKKLFNYKNKDCDKDITNKSLSTDYFRYTITVEQSKDNYEYYTISRILELRVSPKNLPEGFDQIFPTKLKELHIPIKGKIDYNDLIDKFEEIEELGIGDLEDEEEKITFSPYESKNINEIVIENSEIIISFRNIQTPITGMVENTFEALEIISSPIKYLLD